MQEPLVLAGRRGSGTAGEGAVEEQPVVEEEFDLSDILSESVDEAAKSKAELLADIDATLQVGFSAPYISNLAKQATES